MDHPEGAGSLVSKSGRFRLACAAGVPGCAEPFGRRAAGDALGLSEPATTAVRDTRHGKNTVHQLDGLVQQSVVGRLAGYEDVNDADRLALDPVMCQIVGGRAVAAQAA